MTKLIGKKVKLTEDRLLASGETLPKGTVCTIAGIHHVFGYPVIIPVGQPGRTIGMYFRHLKYLNNKRVDARYYYE